MLVPLFTRHSEEHLIPKCAAKLLATVFNITNTPSLRFESDMIGETGLAPTFAALTKKHGTQTVKKEIWYNC